MSPRQRYAYLLEKSKLLKYINFQVKAEFAEKKYIIPLMNNIGLRNLKYNTELWMIDLLRELLAIKDGTFLDVGANIGQTLMKVRRLSEVPYIGFEPNPESVVYLEKLINANKLKGCTICPIGLSDKNTLVTLFSSFEGSPYSTIIDGYNSHWNLNTTHVVSVFRGDDIIPAVFPVDEISVVKIDVEGAELDVIQGMQRLLNEYKPFVVVEIVPVGGTDTPDAEKRQERIEQLLSFIQDANFSVYRVDTKKRRYDRITQIPMGKNQSINYVFVPLENEDAFRSRLSHRITENQEV